MAQIRLSLSATLFRLVLFQINHPPSAIRLPLFAICFKVITFPHWESVCCKKKSFRLNERHSLITQLLHIQIGTGTADFY